MLGNRDLLQRIIRLSLDGGSDATSTVPLHFEHVSAWGTRLLVNRFWKVRTAPLMTHPTLHGLPNPPACQCPGAPRHGAHCIFCCQEVSMRAM